MKKSADSHNSTVPPVLCFTPQRFPTLVSNHVPAQTLISVFLDFVNKMHTRQNFSQDTHLNLKKGNNH